MCIRDRYRALKARFGQTAWFDWPDKDLLNHDPAALAAARQELAEDIAFHQAVQFWFFSQWKALKDHANGLGVRIIGDLDVYKRQVVGQILVAGV